ncbi:hypothetical protein NQZ68_004356 [Dissostichus eleginoides]|nr:hypothetical protein NQZ68_004356 [Dissostichus eleginoides]
MNGPGVVGAVKSEGAGYRYLVHRANRILTTELERGKEIYDLVLKHKEREGLGTGKNEKKMAENSKRAN